MQHNQIPQEERLLYLLQAHVNNKLSSDEQAELEIWVSSSPANRQLIQDMSDPAYRDRSLKEQQTYNIENALNIVKHQTGRMSKKRPGWYRYAAVAASVLIVFASGLYFYNQNQGQRAKLEVYGNDVAPGKQGATLTLANGRQIRLSNAATGEIATEAGVSITKKANGQVVYNLASPPSASREESHIINTLSTARGETYEVQLPDGSTVWLNAASSLTYPASFSKLPNRSVQLTGEAYFEISKDKSRPFIVKADRQEVEVLGTHFNINSYQDEPGIKTTLVEGSVKVDGYQTGRKILLPGQQSILTADKLLVKKANLQEAVAWKEGYFRFYDENIESVMRKLSRWYDIEVQYVGPIPQDEFNGRISLYKHISQVLKQLEKTEGVHFKLEGRRVTVMQ